MENTSTNNNYFRIDMKKWRARVDEVLNERTKRRNARCKNNWTGMDPYYDRVLTKLYSIRAHSRGKLHRKFARLDYYQWKDLPMAKREPIEDYVFAANFGAVRVQFTLEDQAAYIGDSWREFEKSQ